MKLKVLVLLTFIFVVVSCASNKVVISVDANKTLRLHDIWSVEEIYGSAIIQIKNRPNLEIFIERKEILGFGGCNNFKGKIRDISQSKITFSSISSTKKACSNLEIEHSFIKALQATKAYKIEDLKLSFYDSSGSKVIQLRKVD